MQDAARQAVVERLLEKLARANSMTGTDFESLMAEGFRTKGYEAKVWERSGDQGVDLLVKLGRKLVAVQCKNHGRPVGNRSVQEVFAGAKYHGARQAWVVAPEGFTKGAVELAAKLGVKLLGREDIEKLLRD